MRKYSFNIIGAGAIGHLWASFIARQGYDVRLYSRQKRKPQTFKVDSPIANFEQKICYHQLINWKPADCLLVCVKAHQLESLCQQLVELKFSPHQTILMMNGMGLIELIQRYLPQMQTLHASIVHGVYINQQKITHTGNGSTVLGNINTQYERSLFQPLIEQLNTALPSVSWSDKHYQTMLIKVVVNAIINPLTALSNQTNGSILSNGQLDPVAEELLLELKPILRIKLPEQDFSQIKQQVETVARNTRNNISSMLQDIRNGRKTEIDDINGYLLKIAGEEQLTLPLHKNIINNINELG